MTTRHFVVLGLGAALMALAACDKYESPASQADTARCAGGDSGIQLPPGFCATIFADKLGAVRHMVVGQDGTLYANAAPDAEDAAKPSGLIVLRDKDGDGRAETVERPALGIAGGTGIALYRDSLYLEDKDRVVRYALDARTHLPVGAAQTIVSGLPTGGDHRSHSLAIRRDGTLFVSAGSATNACQVANRQSGSPGVTPCAEKAVRAGIWRFAADKADQPFTPANRFASGIRNAVGLTLDAQDRLFATQHGRDQLHENWGALYTAQQGQELPAEELLSIDQGADYGWPECYYDPQQQHLVLAPEYGGDGGKTVGLCAGRHAPIAAFPAHWAPDGLLLYAGRQFPTAYREGAFIAFHGSWNRAPGPQGGFNVVFQPMKDGHATARYVVFADGFAGPGKATGDATHRPTGLATGPDGALYVSDDKGGRIWKITYRGDPAAPVAAAKPAPATAAVAPQPQASHSSGAPAAGVDPASIALGKRLFAGEIAGATCSGCHGARGEGSAVAPNLTDHVWLWGKGDPADIEAIIASGVPKPKHFPAPMPPGGGATLTKPQEKALAAYVWSLSHP
jgi:glucose/arabinose dehydrogenase